MCGGSFRMSDFSAECHGFSNFWSPPHFCGCPVFLVGYHNLCGFPGTPEFSKCPFFLVRFSCFFQTFWVPPTFSNVPFLDIHAFCRTSRYLIFFRMSCFSWISCVCWGPPDFSNIRFSYFFLYSSVPPKFSHVTFFPDRHVSSSTQ